MSDFELKKYEIVNGKVGFAHIFSNNNYKNKLQQRKGNEFDVDKLKTTLPKLGFKVKVHENLEQIDCLSKLKNIAINDGKDSSAILVIFLSHGSLNEVKMTDDTTITIRQIAERFNKKDNSFKGKPKIFLFQMCQGDEAAKSLIDAEERRDTTGSIGDKSSLDSDYEEDKKETSYVIVEEVEDTTSGLPSGSDMFMGFASSPGFVSYRSPKYGSRFIQTFATIVNDSVKAKGENGKIDFLSLMTKVAAEVANMSGGAWPNHLRSKAKLPALESLKNIDKTKARMQMPWYSSTFTRKLELDIVPKTKLDSLMIESMQNVTLQQSPTDDSDDVNDEPNEKTK